MFILFEHDFQIMGIIMETASVTATIIR